VSGYACAVTASIADSLLFKLRLQIYDKNLKQTNKNHEI